MDTKKAWSRTESSMNMAYAIEVLERISLGLPTEDENGKPFPPTIRSEGEKEALRRAAKLENDLRDAEIDLSLQKAKTHFAQAEAALERARAANYYSRRRGGWLEYLFPWL